MHQDWLVRKNHKHYLYRVVSNTLVSIQAIFCLRNLKCYLSCHVQISSHRLSGLVAYRKHGSTAADKDGIKSAVCAIHSTGRRGPERNSRRCGSETAPESGSLSPCSSYFTSSETPPCRPAAPATARYHCGHSPPLCPPSRRSFVPPGKAAAGPTAAAPDRRRPASGHNPCAR